MLVKTFVVELSEGGLWGEDEAVLVLVWFGSFLRVAVLVALLTFFGCFFVEFVFVLVVVVVVVVVRVFMVFFVDDGCEGIVLGGFGAVRGHGLGGCDGGMGLVGVTGGWAWWW